MRSTYTLFNLLHVVYLLEIYTETVWQLKQKWIAPPECVFVVRKQQQTLCVCHALHAEIPKSTFIDTEMKKLFISDCHLHLWAGIWYHNK